jgi:transcription initiation factor TFIIB
MSYVKKCPECGSINLTYDSQLGEIICNDCGLVIEEKMTDSGMDVQGKFDKDEKK